MYCTVCRWLFFCMTDPSVILLANQGHVELAVFLAAKKGPFTSRILLDTDIHIILSDFCLYS